MAAVQPMPMAYGMTQQPMSLGDPFRSMNKEWNSGLCSCCDDISQCCYAYFCWPCFMCSIARKINESKCSCLCAPNALAMYRMKIRTAFQIRGDSYSDHCATVCCGFCAGVQMQKELRYRGFI